MSTTQEQKETPQGWLEKLREEEPYPMIEFLKSWVLKARSRLGWSHHPLFKERLNKMEEDTFSLQYDVKAAKEVIVRFDKKDPRLILAVDSLGSIIIEKVSLLALSSTQLFKELNAAISKSEKSKWMEMVPVADFEANPLQEAKEWMERENKADGSYKDFKIMEAWLKAQERKLEKNDSPPNPQ